MARSKDFGRVHRHLYDIPESHGSNGHKYPEVEATGATALPDNGPSASSLGTPCAGFSPMEHGFAETWLRPVYALRSLDGTLEGDCSADGAC